MKTIPLICAYLGAIIAANLTVALAPSDWRPAVVIVNALVLIGLDLTAGDSLHEAWRGRLGVRVTALIGAGSLLSYLLSVAAGPVALASGAAFLLSATADRLMYAALDRYGWYARVNGSNFISGLVDSTVFLSGLALAGLLPWSLVPALVSAQWAAKVVGGALWSVVLRKRARLC